jgi:uncharacterized protein (DUF2267 family)
MHPNRFYRTVMRACGLDDFARAERATAVVFETLRKRLTVEEAAHVGDQLPVPLKAVWGQGDPAHRLPIKMDLDEFCARVRQEAGLASATQARWVALGVFAALKEQLSLGEGGDVFSQLPRDLKELWVEAQAVAAER